MPGIKLRMTVSQRKSSLKIIPISTSKTLWIQLTDQITEIKHFCVSAIDFSFSNDMTVEGKLRDPIKSSAGRRLVEMNTSLLRRKVVDSNRLRQIRVLKARHCRTHRSMNLCSLFGK
jgi:hypothetical protein